MILAIILVRLVLVLWRLSVRLALEIEYYNQICLVSALMVITILVMPLVNHVQSQIARSVPLENQTIAHNVMLVSTGVKRVNNVQIHALLALSMRLANVLSVILHVKAVMAMDLLNVLTVKRDISCLTINVKMLAHMALSWILMGLKPAKNVAIIAYLVAL